jgi:hypothetical protein
MAKVRCEICQRNFKNEEALAMHNSAMHSSSEKDPSKPGTGFKKWVIGGIIGIAVLALAFWIITPVITGGAVGVGGSSCRTMPAHEMNIGGHQNLAMHIHPELTIIIDGVPQPIPANTGIGPGFMRPIHTHDSTGVLHVEAQCVRTFYLGEFFDTWGMPFSENQIFDKTTNEGTITVTVNGQPTSQYRDLPLRDLDRIVIEFTSF